MQTNNENLMAPKNLVSVFILSVISFFISIGCCYFALFSVSFRFGLKSSANKYAEDTRKCIQRIPHKYLVGSEYLFPCHRFEKDNSSAWTQGLLYILEASYRKQGLEEEFLKRNEYMHFSRTKLLEFFEKLYYKNEEELNLLVGKEFDELIFGDPGNIYRYEEIKKNVFVDNKKNTNETPLLIEKIKVKRYFGIETIKRGLIDNGRPMAVGMVIPNQKIGKASFSPISSWLTHPDLGGRYKKGKYIVANIIGFNDLITLKINNTFSVKGGFILRNEYSQFGHSIYLLDNQITYAQESTICYDPSDLTNWNTTSIDCIKSIMDADKCNATELECIDSNYCNKNNTYVYIGENKFIEWNNDTEPSITTIEIENNYYLPLVVLPKNRKTNESICRYQIIPYETVVEMIRNNDVFSFEPVDIHVSWNDCSYPKKKCKDYNCEILKNETKSYNELSFDNFYDTIL